MSATGSKVVRNANKASSSQLQSCVNLTLNVSHDFRLVHAVDLQDHECNSIWTIFETNMRDLCVILAMSRYAFSSDVAEPVCLVIVVRPSDGTLP